MSLLHNKVAISNNSISVAYVIKAKKARITMYCYCYNNIIRMSWRLSLNAYVKMGYFE
jgi:hypothetical protein